MPPTGVSISTRLLSSPWSFTFMVQPASKTIIPAAAAISTHCKLLDFICATLLVRPPVLAQFRFPAGRSREYSQASAHELPSHRIVPARRCSPIRRHWKRYTGNSALSENLPRHRDFPWPAPPFSPRPALISSLRGTQSRRRGQLNSSAHHCP